MPSASRNKQRRSRSSRSSPIARVLRLFVFVVVLAGGAIAAVWLTRVPGTREGQPQARVLIPAGASFRAAAESLAVAGLIRWPRLFAAYGSWTKRDRTIHAGTYRLTHGQDWGALIDALHTGKGVVTTVKIIEGWPLLKIIPHMAEQLEMPADSLRAAVRDSALRARVGATTETLEGYLFPDTYLLPLGTTARQAVAVMLARFEKIWKPEWTARLDTLKRTRHEIMALASIIETEVEKPEERPVVSAVYWNRLKAGMALQADPTVLYAIGKWASRVYLRDLQVKSPYNTYLRPGLPPGPIASPGAAAIEAALYPAAVPYRYFVAAWDGHHEFRRTFAEHKLAIQKVRAEAKARADSIAKANPGDSAARGAPPATKGRGG